MTTGDLVTTPWTETLLRTSLHPVHETLGARLIPFSGWEMPVQYAGILEEHRAVRQRAGLFDLSHMGELWVTGPDAGRGLAHALVSDPPRLKLGRAHYSMICAPDGGILDDLIVYRLADERFLVVPNASNRERVATELRERLAGLDAALDDASLRTALIAVQGPRALDILRPLTDVDLDALRYYSMVEGHAAEAPAHVARTGYTGEDGFELFLAWDDAPAAWSRLLEAGADHGIAPCGLGARDTLRLEAGMPLYGNELDETINPFEANLGRVVKLDKPEPWVGGEALARVAQDGPARTLVGLVVRGRGIARHGHLVYEAGRDDPSGTVTSGAPSPSLGTPIAMAYLPTGAAQPGTMVEVGIRSARVEAEVVPLPFYTRPD
jgi:aminomethyltransferase